MGSTRFVLAALLIASGVAFAGEPPLDREWSRAFAAPSIDRQVNCAVRWRGGIVIGGSFDLAGSVKAKNIAWWNGSRWYDIGGTDGTVRCLSVIDGVLVVGGEFTRAGGLETPGIARWTGANWSPMAAGLEGGYARGVRALTIFRGDLVAVGDFSSSNSEPMPGAARWDGAAWHALGQGWTHGAGTAAAVYHDRLYVAGNFEAVDGLACQGFAAWDGAHWAPVPWTARNLPYFNTVAVLAVAHDRLYAGGTFDTAGVVPAHKVAAWDGTTWADVGFPDDFGYDVTAFAAHAGLLVASASSGGMWESDGTKWTRRFSNLYGQSWATSLIEDDAGSVVTGSVSAYAQGTLQQLGFDVLVSAGGDWAPLQSWSSDMHGFPSQSAVMALTRYGNDIVAAGGFESVADNKQWKRVDGLARWDGTRWNAFPGWSAKLGGAYGIAASGDTLAVVGDFLGDGGRTPGLLFDGTQWVQLDTINAQFFSPTWFRGSLYVGSFPATSVSNPRGGVYRLDGTHWTEIAAISSATDYAWVYALTVHGGRLVAGGSFDHINGVPAQSVAAWDGTSWTALGALEADRSTPRVWSLADVNGTLYAGGSLGGPNYESVAQWDGSAWTRIGPPGLARSLAAFDGKLHAALDGIDGYQVRSWDGSSWTTLATFNNVINTIHADGEDLWAVGAFGLVDGVPSSRIAHWQHATASSNHQFALSPGYPNPMRESVAFSYSLPSAGEILLTVSDARGRHVATLDSGARAPGDHFVEWDGKDAQGRRAPAGVYFVRLTGASETSRKVVLLP